MALKDELAILVDGEDRRRVLVLLGAAFVGALAEAVGLGAVFPFIALLADPGLVANNPAVHRVYLLAGSPGPEHFVMGCGLALLALFAAKNAFLGLLYFMQSRFVSGLESRLA
ncbi:MAG: hypothetical protein JNM82_16505, partial [Rhodocyclaceae bacterium]|nr:hypothetical protein [Rhodocyclaceae bacterium]